MWASMNISKQSGGHLKLQDKRFIYWLLKLPGLSTYLIRGKKESPQKAFSILGKNNVNSNFQGWHTFLITQIGIKLAGIGVCNCLCRVVSCANRNVTEFTQKTVYQRSVSRVESLRPVVLWWCVQSVAGRLQLTEL